MKCPKCGTESVKADAGMLKSIPYNYCPKCKTEISTKQESSIKFWYSEFNYQYDPAGVHNNLNYNNPYNLEILNFEKIILDNEKSLYDTTVEIINDSDDFVRINLNNPLTIISKALSSKGIDKYVVSVGGVLSITPSTPPQEIRWRTL